MSAESRIAPGDPAASPPGAPAAPGTAPASSPLPGGCAPAGGPAPLTSEAVIGALKPIVDPELRVSVVDLGLIYGVAIEDDGRSVMVRMTLTTPMCPYGPMLVGQVQDVVSCLPGVIEGRVTLVWEPPWDPRAMASDEAKDILNLW
jgi:metal-sulfur cluster biosynthetic enzyme